MKKGILRSILVIVAIFGVCIALGVGRAQAGLIYPPIPVYDPNNDKADFFGDDFVLLDRDGDEEVGISDDYLLVKEDPAHEDDDKYALVSWNTGPAYESYYVAVKDGNVAGPDLPKWVYYEISPDQRASSDGWYAVDTLDDGQGDISHISLYGKVGGTSVPDASVMLILGSSFLGLAVFSKKRKRS